MSKKPTKAQLRVFDEMTNCKECGGLGAVRWRYPNPKPIPSYWFTAGAKTCGECDGTGEAKSPALPEEEGRGMSKTDKRNREGQA